MLRDVFSKLDFSSGNFEKLEKSEHLISKIDAGRLLIAEELLVELCEKAFTELAFLLPRSHKQELLCAYKETEKNTNEHFVLHEILQSSDIALEKKYAICQDTGTAQVFAWKGEKIEIDSFQRDSSLFEKGIETAYKKNNLRMSQLKPLDLKNEKNTGNNLSAQVLIEAVKGSSYDFLFFAKGGGSSNKTFLYQETKALLNEDIFCDFFKKEIDKIGIAACPPYHITVVIGGTSPEANLYLAKIASSGILDTCNTSVSEDDTFLRLVDLEEKLLRLTKEVKKGAQLGGSHFALNVRVFRLSRHAASLPVSISVSCVANRTMRAKITEAGAFLEVLDTKRIFNHDTEEGNDEKLPCIDLNKGIESTIESLSKYKTGDIVSLSGQIVVARDAAHDRFHALLIEGNSLPEYLKKYPIFYGGPTETPENAVIGSFGPTTAGRMDAYIEELMKANCSRITIAKGERNKTVQDACNKYGGFYLACVGGASALFSSKYVKEAVIIDYEDLKMEAVRLITVKNMKVCIICDSSSNYFYS